MSGVQPGNRTEVVQSSEDPKPGAALASVPAASASDKILSAEGTPDAGNHGLTNPSDLYDDWDSKDSNLQCGIETSLATDLLHPSMHSTATTPTSWFYKHGFERQNKFKASLSSAKVSGRPSTSPLLSQGAQRAPEQDKASSGPKMAFLLQHQTLVSRLVLLGLGLLASAVFYVGLISWIALASTLVGLSLLALIVEPRKVPVAPIAESRVLPNNALSLSSDPTQRSLLQGFKMPEALKPEHVSSNVPLLSSTFRAPTNKGG